MVHSCNSMYRLVGIGRVRLESCQPLDVWRHRQVFEGRQNQQRRRATAWTLRKRSWWCQLAGSPASVFDAPGPAYPLSSCVTAEIDAVCTGGALTQPMDRVYCNGDPWTGGPLRHQDSDPIEKLLVVNAQPLVDDIAKKIGSSDGAVHADETYWRLNGGTAYFWVHGTDNYIHFQFDTSRSGQVSRDVLGEHFDGVLVHCHS